MVASYGRDGRLGRLAGAHVLVVLMSLGGLAQLPFAAGEPEAAGQTASEAPPERMLKSGQLYAPGVRVLARDLGISFRIPSGWQGGIPPGTEAFMFSRMSGPAGVGVLSGARGMGWEQLQAAMAEPQVLGRGLVLEPTGPPEIEEGRLKQRYQGGGSVGFGVAWLPTPDLALSLVFVGSAADEAETQKVWQMVLGGIQGWPAAAADAVP